MNTAYSQFTGNSRAGKGKLFYGMTEKRLLELHKIREDEQFSVQSHIENLFTFAGIYIQHARQLAKAGHKDEARNWYRFFFNSRVLDVIDLANCQHDVSPLRESLNFLRLECHPLDVPSFTTDLEAIRVCMAELLAHATQKTRKTKTVTRFNSGRPQRRDYGLGQH